jgi:hypothetical protein
MMMRRAILAPSSTIGGPRAINGGSYPGRHWRRTISAATTAATPTSTTIAQDEQARARQNDTKQSRRALLLLAATTAATTATITTPAPPPASADGLFSPSAQQQQQQQQQQRVPAAGGWSLRPPPGWTLAYDRTEKDDAMSAESGPKVMWANFATLGTIVVSRATRAEARWPAAGGGAPPPSDAARLSDALLADARDSPATYGWSVLASRVSGDASAAPVVEVEYVHQLCRGEVLEAAGGSKRCANPRDDSDLQVVSRHFVLSARADPAQRDLVWVVRGSCPSEAWGQAGPAIAAAVQSFSFSSGGESGAALAAT